MLRKYKFWLALAFLSAGLIAVVQGCGGAGPNNRVIYGASS
jgi:hypothetical protein